MNQEVYPFFMAKQIEKGINYESGNRRRDQRKSDK